MRAVPHNGGKVSWFHEHWDKKFKNRVQPIGITLLKTILCWFSVTVVFLFI